MKHRYTEEMHKLDIDIFEELYKQSHTRITPIRLQLHPTNECNQLCSFCSLKGRSRSQLHYTELMAIAAVAKTFGCQYVKITGGGEPLVHPNINDIITCLHMMGLIFGVQTNGILLPTIENVHYLDWCRISTGDNGQLLFDDIHKVISNNNTVKWGFSYVVTAYPTYSYLSKVINFANSLNAYVRVVLDDCSPESCPSIDEVREELLGRDIDLVNTILQNQKKYTRGSKYCLTSLAEPLVTAEGLILPCCRTNVAMGKQIDHYDNSMSMGSYINFKHIWDEQHYYNGSQCTRCYYNDINEELYRVYGEAIC